MNFTNSSPKARAFVGTWVMCVPLPVVKREERAPSFPYIHTLALPHVRRTTRRVSRTSGQLSFSFRTNEMCSLATHTNTHIYIYRNETGTLRAARRTQFCAVAPKIIITFQINAVMCISRTGLSLFFRPLYIFSDRMKFNGIPGLLHSSIQYNLIGHRACSEKEREYRIPDGQQFPLGFVANGYQNSEEKSSYRDFFLNVIISETIYFIR